jgi:hypothetical protein
MISAISKSVARRAGDHGPIIDRYVNCDTALPGGGGLNLTAHGVGVVVPTWLAKKVPKGLGLPKRIRAAW